MRRTWPCSSCNILLLSAILGRAVSGDPAPTPTVVNKRTAAEVDKIAKAQVTPNPIPFRRDANLCPASYSLCAASLNGGCCLEGYACETDSCYATTQPAASACGRVGWYACAIQFNGGCCPDGYLCGPTDCTAPAGVTNTYTSCPNNYYLCPASYNFGCCPQGMGCAANACFSTAPSTYTVTELVTATTGGQTITSTQTTVTVVIPTPPPAFAPSDPNVAAKFIPTAVPKVEASSTPDSGSSGLTGAQIGGIVGGAVALLLVVLTAAFIIIRHLNRIVEAVESRKDASSGGQTKSQPAPMVYNQNKLRPTPSDVDAMSYDPLMMGNPSAGGVDTPHSLSAAGMRHRSDSEYSTPPIGTPYHGSSSATADLAAIREGGPDSSSEGYFDLPPRIHNMPGRHPGSVGGVASQRISTDSQGTSFAGARPAYGYQQQHIRNYSNTSDMSAASSDAGGGVGSPLIPAELDPTSMVGELPGAPDGGRSRSSSMASPRASSQAQRRSDPPTPATAVTRNEALAGVGFGPAQQLDVVNEGAEVIHGYYGPRDQAVGQTAAGLDINQDLSSPVTVVPRWPDQRR